MSGPACAAADSSASSLIVSDVEHESGADFAERLADLSVDRFRSIGSDPERGVIETCHERGISVDDADPVGAAEIELPRWLREQSVSVTMHRHGRVHRPT